MEDPKDLASYYHKKFREAIVRESIFDNYKDAISEFDKIVSVEIHKSSECICTHAIQENCLVKSKDNGKVLVIGNKCIYNFFSEKMQDEARRLFNLAKRKTQDCLRCATRFTKEKDEIFCIPCRTYNNLCTDCGQVFYVKKIEKSWRKKCYSCYSKSKNTPNVVKKCLFDEDAE